MNRTTRERGQDSEDGHPRELRPEAIQVPGQSGWRGALLRRSDERVEWSCSHSDHGTSIDSATRCAIEKWQHRYEEWRETHPE
jgi:hypothetical protein